MTCAAPPTPAKRDEPTAIPLDPEEALRAILQVDPECEPAERDADQN